jgi:hypothetical protein
MLTIQEASQVTGKSQKTIRRLIKRLLQTDKSASKKIQQVPYPGGFTYKIDKDYLLGQFQSPTPVDTLSNSSETPQSGQEDSHSIPNGDALLKSKDETISVLKTEIDQLHKTIGELLERDKERNILFHKFQDALMLEAPKQRVDTDSLSVQRLTSQDVQEGRQEEQSKPQSLDINHQQKVKAGKQEASKPNRKQTHKSKSTKQEQPKKKGFFSFLTGK